MNKTTILAVLAAGFCLAGYSTAAAQTQESTKIFIDVNGGGQTQSRSFETRTSFPLRGETAAINTAQSIASGGLFDFSVGYRILPSLGAGVGVSTFSDTGGGAVAASIPSAVFVNRPASVSATSSDLEHNEVATHVMIVYFHRLPANIEVALHAGPSFFNVSQDYVTATIPAGTQSLALATHRERVKTVGANIGVNVNYLVRRNYGAGVFLRYAGATADLATAGELKVGGLQLGGGARLRF